MALSRLGRAVAPVAVALTACTPALAGGPPPAAIAQYVEVIPAAGGSVVAGRGRPTVSRLPPAIEQSLDEQAGNEAPVLKKLATSSRFGAPQVILRDTKGPGMSQRVVILDRKLRAATRSSPTLAGGGGNASVLGLAVVLGVATVSLVALRPRRLPVERRRPRRRLR